MEYFKLNNGNLIPCLGLGTYKIIEPKEVEKSVKYALEVGYKLIDTASVYQNEAEIGNVIKKYNIDRSKIFITSKVWNSEQGYNNTIRAFEQSLKKLQTDYIDMYLIHWAVCDKYQETWRAMEYLYKQGVVKNIGVSNFQIHHLEKLMQNSKIVPVINQVELHPYFSQIELRDFCKKHNILVQSWSPIAKGSVSDDKKLQKIAEKYEKTAVQIVLRWHIQNGLLPIPKSVNPERIKLNFNVFDFQLSEDDMKEINSLNINLRKGPDPDNFNF